MSPAPEGLWELLDEYLRAEGLELDDLEMAGRGRGAVLRIVVDRAGGVDVDRLAETSRGLSRLLDQHEDLQNSYTLEVTSPGLERKLRRPQHFRKSLGRELVVKTREEIEGERSHRGTLDAVDESSCVIRVGEAERRIPLDAITSARTVFRWEPAPKPGAKAARREP